jgi:hypothetical protein
MIQPAQTTLSTLLVFGAEANAGLIRATTL